MRKIFGVCHPQITEWVTAPKYWIGLDDLENEGSFVWGSGRPLSAFFGRDHWADGQPNGTPSGMGTQNDHCVCVGCYDDSSSAKKMWDTVCDRPHHFVCQKSMGKPSVISLKMGCRWW